MEQFVRERRGKNYTFEREILPRENVIVEIPSSCCKDGINEIGVSSTSKAVKFLYTFSQNPLSADAIWISADKSGVNKAATAIRARNNNNKKQRLCMRVAYK